MGRLLATKDLKKGNFPELLNYGFEFQNSGAIWREQGYERTFDFSIYTLWVFISNESGEAYYYLEYDCGGEIVSGDYCISPSITDDFDGFMKSLDYEVEDTIKRWE